MGRTIDDPRLDLGELDLQCCGDDRVGHVAADVLEGERGEREQADLALQECVVQLCGALLSSCGSNTEERAPTILGERVGVTLRPCLVLREAVVEEDLEERKELVVFGCDNRVETEEGVEVEERGQAEGSSDGVDRCALCG